MFLSMIQNRRSIRNYQKQNIDPEKIMALVEVALRAPSSRDLKPCEFIVVDQPRLLEKLAIAKQHGSAFLRNAPLAIVICADPGRSDVWIEDTSIAATYIQLMAEALGLGSCWIQIRERMQDMSKTSEEYIKEILNIPGHLKVEAVVAIGYPAVKLPPHPKPELEYAKVFYNEYKAKLPF